MSLIGGCLAAAFEGYPSLSREQAFQTANPRLLQSLQLRGGGFFASRDLGGGNASSTFAAGTYIVAIVARRNRLASLRHEIESQWGQLGPKLLATLRDDFALASWDKASRELVLARSPFSSSSLFYRQTGENVAFATLAPSLAEGCRPNFEFLEAYQRPAVLVGQQATAFSGVNAVEPGCAVRLREGYRSVQRFWHAEYRESRGASKSESLRAALDASVADALVGAGQPAVHLSSGRDSSAVAAAAAIKVAGTGNKLLAYTAVPSPRALLPDGVFVADEGEVSHKVAALYPGIDHHRVITEGFKLGALLDEVSRLSPSPHGTPVNLPWWATINAHASGRGAVAVLTGAAGNWTVSAGGPGAIRDLLSSGDLLGWSRAIRAAARAPRTSWLSLLDLSLGPSVPSFAYDLVKRASGRSGEQWGRFLAGELGHRVRSHSEPDLRPHKSWCQVRRESLEHWEASDPANELLFGVTMRDPTADLRVVEASLALNRRELASPYDRRWIYDAAFGDRLPPEVLRKQVRGLQAADWTTMIDAQELRERFEVHAQSRSVAEYIDISAVRAALARWPSPGQSCEDWEVFTLELLPAIALSSFLHVHWPG